MEGRRDIGSDEVDDDIVLLFALPVGRYGKKT